MARTSLLLPLTALLLALPACQRKKPVSPYLRIEADNGRLHFADRRNLLQAGAAGFISFRDLVTNERVRLPEGSYRFEEVPFSEVERWRTKYMYNPSRPPRVADDKR